MTHKCSEDTTHPGRMGWKCVGNMIRSSFLFAEQLDEFVCDALVSTR